MWETPGPATQPPRAQPRARILPPPLSPSQPVPVSWPPVWPFPRSVIQPVNGPLAGGFWGLAPRPLAASLELAQVLVEHLSRAQGRHQVVELASLLQSAARQDLPLPLPPLPLPLLLQLGWGVEKLEPPQGRGEAGQLPSPLAALTAEAGGPPLDWGASLPAPHLTSQDAQPLTALL